MLTNSVLTLLLETGADKGGMLRVAKAKFAMIPAGEIHEEIVCP